MKKRSDIRIEEKKGRLGDLRITLDGEEIFYQNRLLFPTTRKVMGAVEGYLPV